MIPALSFEGACSHTSNNLRVVVIRIAGIPASHGSHVRGHAIAHWHKPCLRFNWLWLFVRFNDFIICVQMFLPVYVYEHHVHTWCLGRPEEGVISPGTEITSGCEPTYVLGMEPGSSAPAELLPVQ